MYTLRELLAIGLAAMLGVVLVVAPRPVIRLQLAWMDPTSGRHGEWGDGDGRELQTWWVWAARAVGLAILAVGGFVAAQPLL